MNLAILAFTDRGYALAQTLAAKLEGQAWRSGEPLTLYDWTAQWFPKADALIYVGAAGIAVRAIAPYVQKKDQDPAVVVVDELGTYAIPILSGHLGGANDLARQIALVLGAQPVITTATDLHQRFAVDEWARHQDCAVVETDRILPVSSRILAGETVTVTSKYPIAGSPPEGVVLGSEGQVRLSVWTDDPQALHLVPRTLVLGVGCKKNTPAETLEAVFQEFAETYGFWPQGIRQVCSITLKEHELGLQQFCKSHHWPFQVFSPEQLKQLPGPFTASEFVQKTAGVDNVCERSAVAGSEGGRLLCPKFAKTGVTLALAQVHRSFTWDWGL